MKILSFGEIVWDIYDDRKCLGGAPLNFAAHLAKHGHEVYMYSAVGCDEFGNEVLSQVKKWGISNKYVFVLNNKQTGRCLVELDENAVPSYRLLENVAYDNIPHSQIKEKFDVLYFGSLALRGDNNCEVLSNMIARCNFKEIFVDINIRAPYYSNQSVAFCFKNASFIKISHEELCVVNNCLKIDEKNNYKETVNIISQKYPNLKCIIITLGSDGAYVYDCINKKDYISDSSKVKTVSTVGAGDSFSAAFLHQYLNRKNLCYCAEYANRVAGFVVSQYDAVPEYDIKSFYN